MKTVEHQTTIFEFVTPSNLLTVVIGLNNGSTLNLKYKTKEDAEQVIEKIMTSSDKTILNLKDAESVYLVRVSTIECAYIH